MPKPQWIVKEQYNKLIYVFTSIYSNESKMANGVDADIYANNLNISDSFRLPVRSNVFFLERAPSNLES